MTSFPAQAQKHVLKRITIVSKACACPLYDHIYSWQAEDKLTATSAKIATLFNTIAATFNDKDDCPRRVVFEQQADQGARKTGGSHFHAFAGGLPALGSRSSPGNALSGASRFMMATTPVQNSVQMEIYLLAMESIVVTVYVKPGHFISDEFEPLIVRDLGQDFLRHFQDSLDHLRPVFEQLASDQEAARNNTSYMNIFSEWKPVVPSDYITEEGAQTENFSIATGTSTLPLSNDLMMSWAQSHKDGEAAIAQLLPSHFTQTTQRQTAVETQTNLHAARRQLQQHVTPPSTGVEHSGDAKTAADSGDVKVEMSSL